MNVKRRQNTGRGAATALAGMLAALMLFSAGCDRAAEEPLTVRFLKEHNLQGRVVLIEFGLIGCELSQRGLDMMMRLHEEKGIPNLAYARVEGEKDTKVVDEYYATAKPGFTVYHDPDTSLAKAFDATIYPRFVLVDKFDRVRYRGSQPAEAKLSDWVLALAAETTDPGPDAVQFGVSKVAVHKLLDETRLPALKGDAKPMREYLGPAGMLAVFVDTTCPFSGEAIGDMQKVAGTLAQHKVPCILLNVGDPEDAVRAFYDGQDIGAPVLYDITNATQDKWKVDFVPTTVFFAPDGTIVYRGKAVWADVASAAEKTLNLAAGTIQFGCKGTEYG
ncbi:MAG TPA: TlpA family protein disulfide reductase [Phycisphaerae bacterium]|nr:TlpA family protein disulfide reductase [Phycisphaerae bacterium]